MTEIFEILKNDWLQISVVTFMVIMLIFGYYRGLIKMSSNLVSLVLSVILTKSLRPYFQEWITNNDFIRTYVNNRIHEKLADNNYFCLLKKRRFLTRLRRNFQFNSNVSLYQLGLTVKV